MREQMKKVKIICLLTAIVCIFASCGKKETQKSEENVVSTNVTEQSDTISEIKENNDYPIEEGDLPIGQTGPLEEITSNGYKVVGSIIAETMYVNTGDSKLNYRDNPVDGKVLGKFLNGDEVIICKYTEERFKIDDLEESWVYVRNMDTIPHEEGWVYAGFLSYDKPEVYYSVEDSIDLNLICDEWEDDSYIVRIHKNGEFSLIRKESEGMSGRWRVDNKILYAENLCIYDEEPSDMSFSIKICKARRLVLVRDDWVLDLRRKGVE